MTAAAYTTDLTPVLSTAENTTNWSGVGFGTGILTNSPDPDNYIQGSNCCSSTAKATGVGGGFYNRGSGWTCPTDGAFLAWGYYAFTADVATETNGGFRLAIGSATSAYKAWYVGGADTFPYGGWRNYACNPTVAADATVGGGGSGTLQYFGFLTNLLVSTGKGSPWSVDQLSIGRCEARFAGGTAPDAACTFAGYAAQNDAVANRWGLLQSILGVYLWKGLLVIGYGAACRFVDANVNVSIDNTKKVTANFNTIEVRNASTVIDWTGINFTALGTVSPGRWITTDDASITLTSCSFTDMGVFGFLGNANIQQTTFRRCDQITLTNSIFKYCRVEANKTAANTSAVVWNNNTNPNGYLDYTTFVKGATANHAVEFGTNSPTSMTLTGVVFTGYNASNNQNDSAIHIKRTSGEVTITIAGGGSTPSYRTDGATVTIVSGAVDATVVAQDSSGANISGARVLLKAAAGGPFPVNVTVTITNSDTTATVAHSAHGLSTNDKILIDGASLWQNNGVFPITRVDDNSYTYTLPSAPGSNPTGTIKATFVVLEGLTGGAGITMSRIFPSDQPVTGWARKSSSAPYYKTGPLSGVVKAASGYSGVAVMISDE